MRGRKRVEPYTGGSEEVLAEADRLFRCQYNWDGNGALPMRSDVYRTVKTLFTALPLGCDNLKPSALLNPDGTFALRYAVRPNGVDKELLLSFRCGGVITYVKIFEDQQTSIEGTLRIDIDKTDGMANFGGLAELFHWFASE